MKGDIRSPSLSAMLFLLNLLNVMRWPCGSRFCQLRNRTIEILSLADGIISTTSEAILDRYDTATRSRVMGKNKSQGTKTTEWRFRSLLIRSGVKGWKMGHDSGLPGRPDIVFPDAHLAIFLDGCFWHGCRHCRSIPATNREFWTAKINRNRRRDRKVGRELLALGWKSIRIWEHELKAEIDEVLRKVLATLRSSGKAFGSR